MNSRRRHVAARTGRAAEFSPCDELQHGLCRGRLPCRRVTLGLSAPRSFWAAMPRAAAAPVGVPDASGGAAATSVVPMTPDTPVPTVAEARGSGAGDRLGPGGRARSGGPMRCPRPRARARNLLDGPRGGTPDDLTVLTVWGAKLATALNEFGIYHYDQIAALERRASPWLDAQQKGFRMTCARLRYRGGRRARSPDTAAGPGLPAPSAIR